MAEDHPPQQEQQQEQERLELEDLAGAPTKARWVLRVGYCCYNARALDRSATH